MGARYEQTRWIGAMMLSAAAIGVNHLGAPRRIGTT